MNSSPIFDSLSYAGVIPVVEIPHPDLAVPLAEALASADLPVIEVTFRTSSADESISRIKKVFPKFTVGAGTLLNEAQVEMAVRAGADFGVSPGLNLKVVKRAHNLQFPHIPGVMTPSEVESGLENSINFFKLFPSEAISGLKLLPSFKGPYRSAKFMPTGGVSIQKLSEYLSNENVFACGGTWIATRQMIENRKFDEISNLARGAVKEVKEIRNRNEDQ